MEMCVLTTESTKEVTETVQDTVGEVGRMTEYLQIGRAHV